MKGSFLVNGRTNEWTFEPDATLLDVLRANGHPEVHRGCDEGVCGSCSLLLEGKLVNSCQVFAASAMEKDILTVAGIGTIKTARSDGFVRAEPSMRFVLRLRFSRRWPVAQKSNPTDEEIHSALDGNYCRCTGYVKLLSGPSRFQEDELA